MLWAVKISVEDSRGRTAPSRKESQSGPSFLCYPLNERISVFTKWWPRVPRGSPLCPHLLAPSKLGKFPTAKLGPPSIRERENSRSRIILHRSPEHASQAVVPLFGDDHESYLFRAGDHCPGQVFLRSVPMPIWLGELRPFPLLSLILPYASVQHSCG